MSVMDLPLDEAWYLSRYRAAAEDISAGLARDASDHYYRLGLARGYIPNPTASRPVNAANYRSRFGGLWTDLANAHDIIAGKHHLGWISDDEASLLTHWVEMGFVQIPQTLTEDVLLNAQAALTRAYQGGSNSQLFDCPYDGPTPNTFRAHHIEKPAKALCIHWLSPAIREAIFCEKITRFLSLIFERPALATQTLGFHRGSAQGGHQDSAFVGYTLQMQFAASWIALEDVQATAGELFYYTGSHRIPEYFYGGDYKNANELARFRSTEFVTTEKQRYDLHAAKMVSDLGLTKQRFLPKAGDALIWSADLLHGGSPVSSDLSRQSVVTHYCPAEVAPLYYEYKEQPVIKHRTGNFYSTYNYSLDVHVED